MQKKQSIKPLFLDCDSAYEELKPSSSPFIKGLSFDIGANPVNNIGTSNPTGEGQNFLVQSTIKSNVPVMNVTLPIGFNKHIGSFESVTTQELYHFNFNINGNHGVYVLSGNTGLWSKVIEDPALGFVDNQENYIANHRVLIRFIKDKNGNIIEKFLLITEGNTWQKYINVIAAQKTNGFDQAAYPYWELRQPHFDRREFVEWATRPPMQKPVVTPLANTDGDRGKINRFIDKGIQVGYEFQYTDGRVTALSPYSLPVLIKSEDFINNPDSLPKNVSVKLYAGSTMVEKILFYVRTAKENSNTLPSIQEWGDWYLYDAIKRFPDSNTGTLLETDYWLRTNQWEAYNYDNVFNTIDYVFDLSKAPQITDQGTINMIQTAMPQLSIAITDLGDAALLCNNRDGYPNFPESVLGNFEATIESKVNNSCAAPLRNITLYAYVGMRNDDSSYISQVGYYNGDDKKIRFGGMRMFTGGSSSEISIDLDESKFFNLDFGDKNSFRCYFKGTPYYADGEWCKVYPDNSIEKLPSNIDISDISVKREVVAFLQSNGYYVCRFKIAAPAGRYTATLGRHNINSNGDYRNKSTYIYGIANSKSKQITTAKPPSQYSGGVNITVIKPSAINANNGILYSKEMEIDCTNSDVDVWGNGSDLFYVFCPYIQKGGNNNHYRFIEGYLQEKEPDAGQVSIPVELFPYILNHTTFDGGKFTDKNGFYWGYTGERRADLADTYFTAKVDCVYPKNFLVVTGSIGDGWKQNPIAYLSNYSSNFNANRIIVSGKITDISGIVPYSNIAISIKDGSTVYSRSDGTFTLIAHNGRNVLRVSNIYVNAGGNFFITLDNCGQVPLYNFTEPSCNGNSVRNFYPNIDISVKINSEKQTSLKDTGKYSVGLYGADLAGRIMNVNIFGEIEVPSFLERENLDATFIQVALGNGLDFNNYPDMRYLIFCVSKNLSIKRYIQWIGDEIDYIDNNGQQVTDAASAVFVSIKINSLLNSNIAKNLSLLSSYQFVEGDRLRILDDGDGNPFYISGYGQPIDLQILGTNYQQAAVDSGLLPPSSNTVLSTQSASPDVTLIVKYDSKLDRIIGKTGFWIEVYTPTQQSDIIPFYETEIYPIINGRPVIFTGYSGGVPHYSQVNTVDINFWDTYFFNRSITIPDVGNKYFNHPFESQNVTDDWGANLISGGRNNVKNDNAKQTWLPGGTIKSDEFLKEGLTNGLASFREGNKKDFGSYPFGGIVAAHSERNVIHFSCENDWFITDYNFHYAFINEQGVMVANLDNGLSTPHQKIGSKFGLAKEDTGTYIPYDKEIYWYDRMNDAYVRMNYRSASDVVQKGENENGGVKSLFSAKIGFITKWNNDNIKENRFDIISGIDNEMGKIYITFRCRRNNSQSLSSFINDRRDWQLNFQETIVYDTINKGFLRSEPFTPEGYGSIRGNETGSQMLTFASGKPYLHNDDTDTFNNYYGIQTTPIITGVFNESNQSVKIFDALLYSGNPSGWFVDKIYTDFRNSFSYLSSNQFRMLFNKYYAAVMRNMNSYPSTTNQEEQFRSMLFDGYFIRGKYFVVRMVGNYDSLGGYKELGEMTSIFSLDESNEK